MFTPVVMENYRSVKKGEQFETLDEAKESGRQFPLKGGQMLAVIDDRNVLCWKGGIVPKEKPKRVRSAKAGQASV